LGFLFVAVAGITTACTSVEPGDEGLGTATAVTTTGGSSGTGDMTTAVPESSSSSPDPDSSGGGTACEGETIDAPVAPEGWQGPFLMYGFAGNVGTPPDCGEGTAASSVGQFSVDTTTCACECSAPPEDLCAVSMFSSCEGQSLGFYDGGCTAFDEPVPAFKASAAPLGACPSVAAPVVPPLAPSVWSCEIPADGCSAAPPNEGVCIFAEGTAGACPAGFENGPVASNRVTCDGACPNCVTPEYCSTGIEFELHDTEDCSTLPAETISPLECPTGPYAAMRAAPKPLTCVPDVELMRTPLVISICCQP
jgi:hypothetical protein